MRHYSAATNHRAEPLAARKARVHENARLCVCACVRRAQGSADSGTLRASCMYIYILQVGVAHPRKSPFLWDWCTRRYYDCPFLSSLLEKRGWPLVEISSLVSSPISRGWKLERVTRGNARFLEGGVNNESMERTSRRGNLWDGLSAVVRVTNSYTSAMVYLIARLWKLIKVSGGGVNGSAVNRGAQLNNWGVDWRKRQSARKFVSIRNGGDPS